MSNLEDLFPSESFTEGEQDALVASFSNPLVIKYLTHLAREDSKELLSLSPLVNSPEYIHSCHSVLSGKLAVYSTLLSIAVSEKS